MAIFDLSLEILQAIVLGFIITSRQNSILDVMIY